MEYLSDLRLFCEISRTLNFREAGEKLGYSPAVVSMRIKRLETVTGKTLFLRSTRHIAITEEGRELLALAEKALDLAELMTGPRQGASSPAELKGSVRISAPHSFARVFLLEPLKQIHETWPRLSIELVLEDKLTELIQEGIDITFRIGGQVPHGVDSLDLLQDHRILAASPQYLQARGEPKKPDDLRRHHCLSYPGMKAWVLTAAGKQERVNLEHSFHCNTGDFLTQLAIKGVGIIAKSAWSIHSELTLGTLQRILPDHTLGQPSMIRLLTPRREVTPMRVQQVMGLLQRHIQQAAPELMSV